MIRTLSLVLALVMSVATAVAAPQPPTRLRTAGLTDPMNVEPARVSFSWEMVDPTRSARQTAYELVIREWSAGGTEGPVVWTSGRVESNAVKGVAPTGDSLVPGVIYEWRVRTWNDRAEASEFSPPARFSVVVPADVAKSTPWIGDAGVPGPGFDALPAPRFRRDFEVPASPVVNATLTISALGVYEAFINGQRVGNQQLAPEWTDYTTRVQYQTYDVTSHVKAGANAIGVQVTDGWYAGRLGMAQQFTPDKRPRAVYGRTPRLMARLDVRFADGSVKNIVTDGSWSSTVDGPVRSADFLDGQVIDHRREVPGWDRAGFDAKTSGQTWKAAIVDASIKTQLVPQMNDPIRATMVVKPIALTNPTPGVYVFDMGQNMPGWVRVNVTGAAGSTLTLKHTEAINDDGTVYTANLRGAPQVDRFILSGRPGGETFEPTATYHGFRFVEWTGDVAPPTIASLTGVVVHTDAPRIGTFESSSPLLNKLWENIQWTQRANLMSVPTDCPQRDERLGWMGDILAFGQTACFSMDLDTFYTKWTTDVRDAQADDGRMPDIAPHPYGKNERFTGVPGWGDAGVVVPSTAFLNYGNPQILRENADASRRWVKWIESKNPDLIWRNNRHNDYNDWLNGDTLIRDGWPRTGGEVPRDIFATAMFAQSAKLASQMYPEGSAERTELADLHTRIKAAFQSAFISADASMPGDTQAGYALALGYELMPDALREQAADKLAAGIRKYNGHLSTGFHSTHHAMLELTRAGELDLAYGIALKTDFPSWGYSIENGATTIWERWDGYVKGRGFQDPGMNSLNHWALGSVGEWMMRVVGGINNDPAHPGWSHFILSPMPGGGLTHATATHRTAFGTIESSWRVEGDLTRYSFVVPPNSTATLHLPARDQSAVKETTASGAGRAVVVRTHPARRTASATVEMALQAGAYTFDVTK